MQPLALDQPAAAHSPTANGHGKRSRLATGKVAAEAEGSGSDDDMDGGDDDDDQPGASHGVTDMEDGEEEDGDGVGGHADGDEASDDEDDDVSMAAQMRRGALTLRGLVRRMARLAGDTRWVRQRQRLTALRWTAAAASALGAEAAAPYLPLLLRPLFRITDTATTAPGAAGTAVPEDARALADEVMAHLRELVGSDVLLAAYNQAREHVRGARAERKRKQSMRIMLDPAAAASARLKHNARKAVGRQRRMELQKRERGTQIRGSSGGQRAKKARHQ